MKVPLSSIMGIFLSGQPEGSVSLYYGDILDQVSLKVPLSSIMGIFCIRPA